MASGKTVIENSQVNSFSLKHEAVADFFKSEWPREPKNLLWVVFRWCLAAFFSTAVPCSMVSYYDNGIWFIYLTNWGFCLCMLSADIGAVLSTLYYCGKAHFTSNSVTLKIYWLIYTISIVLAPVVSIIYWCLLHNGTTNTIDWINLSSHALNSILPLTDFALSAMPIRIMHATYVIAFGLVYAAFTVVYHMNGGLNTFGQPFIYPILNWAYPNWAVLCIVLVSAMLLLNTAVLYFVSKGRAYLAKPPVHQLLGVDSHNSSIG